jgi:coenzyme F420 hydrogenase subunit beta
LQPISPEAVIAAQPALVGRHRELFGRLFAMWLLCVPSPRFRGFHLFRVWRRIPFRRKVQTVLGTMRRLLLRNLLVKRPVF